MAHDAGDEFRRPVPLALAGVAIIGWLLAAFLWSQASQTESQMTESLHAAERARESLAADLQNLQKAAGTAAELKAQATEAEKALSEASAARASAQNELADLTKQINDAKLAISGAQEEASAKARDLQAVDARLKEESDRLAGMQAAGSGAFGRADPVAGPGRGCARRPLRGPEPDRRRAEAVRERCRTRSTRRRRNSTRLQSQIRAARPAANPAQ